MLRPLFFGFLLIACITTSSCQTYPTSLQQSVVRADEVSAVAALHSIAVAQRSYAATSGGDYGTFQQLSQGDYLDSRFNSDKPEVKGYVLTMLTQKSEGGPPRFSCSVDPISAGEQAGRHFYLDSDSTQIRVNPSQPATASDPVFQP